MASRSGWAGVPSKCSREQPSKQMQGPHVVRMQISVHAMNP